MGKNSTVWKRTVEIESSSHEHKNSLKKFNIQYYFCIYHLRSAGQTEVDGNGRASYSRANKNGMMCYIKIKLAKSIQEPAKDPEIDKKCATSRLPSNPTQTRNVLPQNQQKRKPSPVRRSPRKKKAAISLVEDAPEVQSPDVQEVQSSEAPEVQSSDSEFSHIKALLSAPATNCHDVKGNMATANHSAKNRSTTKITQTELTSTPETPSLTVGNGREKDPVEVEATNVPDMKGDEVFYASSFLQHFVSCAENVTLHTDSSTVKSECPVHGKSDSVTNKSSSPVDGTTSPHETPADVDALKENANVGDCQESPVPKESEKMKLKKNVKIVKKKEAKTDDMLFTNEGEKIKTKF